ncbi:MAG: hypothetical protein JXC32_10720 [Anaerolineae bacterium]|nr:hypothetical protein [Anaerolineae bacterium]
MEPLVHYLSHPLCWVQPRTLSREFELRNEAGTLATLTFETALGSLATARTSSGEWSLKRMGFFKPVVTVREAGEEANVAVYRPRWTGAEGDLELGGHQYRFKTSNFWATQFEIRDSADRLLISYHAGVKKHTFGDLFKTQAEVSVVQHGADPNELALLIIIGWYIIVLHNEDSSAVAVAGAAAAS